MNLYQYVKSNSVTNNDPLGLMSLVSQMVQTKMRVGLIFGLIVGPILWLEIFGPTSCAPSVFFGLRSKDLTGLRKGVIILKKVTPKG